jgi:hypothetical protein
MAKEERIVHHTRAEVAAMIESGEISMNLRGAREISDEELEAIIATDPDDQGADVDRPEMTTTIPLSSEAPVKTKRGNTRR